LRLILNNNPFTNRQKGKENINVNAVVRDVADIKLRSRCLSEIVPKNISIARITAGDGSIGLKQKQAA